MSKQTVILSIDDDEQICYALGILFSYQGWHMLAAHDVTSGIEIFRRERPDIVLIDYHMPGINGISGIKMLRALSPDVPIIVFTIEERQEVADQFLSAGASDIAIKPIKAPDIVSRVKVHLRLLESSAGSSAQWRQETIKGISFDTMQLILGHMREAGGFCDVKLLACATGLAEQTVYRYLQYLEQEGRVEVQVSYGKVGRPKQRYRLVGLRGDGATEDV